MFVVLDQNVTDFGKRVGFVFIVAVGRTKGVTIIGDYDLSIISERCFAHNKLFVNYCRSYFYSFNLTALVVKYN